MKRKVTQKELSQIDKAISHYIDNEISGYINACDEHVDEEMEMAIREKLRRDLTEAMEKRGWYEDGEVEEDAYYDSDFGTVMIVYEVTTDFLDWASEYMRKRWQGHEKV